MPNHMQVQAQHRCANRSRLEAHLAGGGSHVPQYSCRAATRGMPCSTPTFHCQQPTCQPHLVLVAFQALHGRRGFQVPHHDGCVARPRHHGTSGAAFQQPRRRIRNCRHKVGVAQLQREGTIRRHSAFGGGSNARAAAAARATAVPIALDQRAPESCPPRRRHPLPRATA